ncbi:hypothetical protein SSABA_v1c07290 [Spiroplasma sabaudiense Ar-1343]|uniref:Transmembrane protein n=1 Tax=Spiroplasma sabaudiense Ar-1343 TaxID=1276257 RepID=W6AAU3_9MOLU|nr:hypothetical protein [Spiroplasma sabaudiense]AHI54131.1 hypothetical protein SSABA_v1c07290 [Spiroplasma sabaudiense Ar-1343]
MKLAKLKFIIKITTSICLLIYLLMVILFFPRIIATTFKNDFLIYLYGFSILTIILLSVIVPLKLWDFKVEKRNYYFTIIYLIAIFCTQIPMVGMLSYSLTSYSQWVGQDMATRLHLLVEAVLLFTSSILLILAITEIIILKKPQTIDVWDSIISEIEKRSILSAKNRKKEFNKVISKNK